MPERFLLKEGDFKEVAQDTYGANAATRSDYHTTAGRKAKEAGKSEGGNPYPKGSDPYRQWREGFLGTYLVIDQANVEMAKQFHINYEVKLLDKTSTAKDAYGANAATRSELESAIKFPSAKPKETRAINMAFANGRDATLRNRRKRLARDKVAFFDEFKESEHPRGQPENAGQFTSGSGGGGAKAKGTGQQAGGAQPGSERSANELLQHETATVDDVVSAVPGSREFLAMARGKLAKGVPTDAPVAKGGFKNPDGSWTPERAAIHKQMVQDVFTPDAVARAIPERGKRPVLDILGGRGGSGKSWFTGPEGSVDRSRSIYLNNDDFKEGLPEYQGWNAALLHEESSHIGDRAETIAREAGLNTTIDGTMKSSDALNARIDAFKKAGYEIRGHYMYTSPVNSAMRALGRGVRGQEKTGKGRYVPPEYSLTSKTNEASFDSARHKMDDWEVYDNNGEAPVFFSRKAR